MLRILGSFKVVPDLEALEAEDWKPDEQMQLDTGYVKQDWNCFDEGALEMMLKLSAGAEGLNMDFQLAAVTIGTPSAEAWLHTLQALGFRCADRISSESELRFWPEARAALLAAYCREVARPDVLVAGYQSADETCGLTPLLTAERLGWPCITQVTDMRPCDDGHLWIEQLVDRGRVLRKVRLPVVLVVGNSPCAYLRVPTLKDRLQRGRREVPVYSAEDLGVDLTAVEQPGKLVSLQAVENRRAGKSLPGTSPQEQARALYELYWKGRRQAQ